MHHRMLRLLAAISAFEVDLNFYASTLSGEHITPHFLTARLVSYLVI